MTPVLSFHVGGDPAPKGSKRHVGGGRMIESSKNVGPWMDSVHYAAVQAMRQQGWVHADSPVVVSLSFFLRRPQSAPKARTRPDRKPDGDKLERAVLDALTTAGVYTDDARVVAMTWGKHYAPPGGETGCRITVTRI